MTARVARVAPLALLLAAASCAAGEAGGAPPAPDGARLYRAKCASCHRLREPAEHDAATWRRAVERFGDHLTPEQREAITGYLVERARPAP